MEKIGKLLVWISFFILALSEGSLALVTVSSEIDQKIVERGEPFQVVVTVNVDENIDIGDPKFEGADGLDLVNRSQQVSQRLQQTNKGMQFQTSHVYIYFFQGQKVGQIKIPSFVVDVGGKTYHTEEFTIKVVPPGQAPKKKPVQNSRQNRGFGMDVFDDMDKAEDELFNQLFQGRRRLLEDEAQQQQHQQPQMRNLPINTDEAFFVHVDVDKTEVFEGEQITANWYLYTRGMLETLERLKFPDLKGFWKEVIEEVPAYQPYEEIVNGVPYRKALLASHALFPIKAGTSVIDEYKIRSKVRMPLSRMGGFGFGNSYEYTKSSKRINIKVKPLPVESRPPNFSGAVGQFEVLSSVEEKNLPVNQPFTLKVRFEGVGNAKLIDLPPLNLPESLEIYDTKSNSKFFKDSRSFKEFEVLIVPHQTGSIEIPSLSIGTFDPVLKKYVVKSTPPIQLTIIESQKGSSSSKEFTSSSDQSKNLFGESDSKKLPALVLAYNENELIDGMKNPFVFAGIFTILLVLLIWKAKKELSWGRQSRTLKDIVEAKFNLINQAQKENNYRLIGTEFVNIFYLVLSHLSGQEGSNQEISKLIDQVPPSLRRDHGVALAKYFDIFQTLGFAPDEMLGPLKSQNQLIEHTQKAKELIRKVIP